MISYRQADLLEVVEKHRVYDVFFYVWFDTDHTRDENLVRDHNGRLSARLEIYFPDKLTKRDEENNIAAKIKNKIEHAIDQPINHGITSKPNEDISQFYENIRENLEPKLRTIDAGLNFDSLISHGMKFHLRMKAI